MRVQYNMVETAEPGEVVGEQHKVPPILLPFVPIHKRALGVACGVVAGAGIWLATAILLLKGGSQVGPTLELLNQYLVGYDVTWPGAFIGLAWGFALGFVFGWMFAALRNMTFRLWLYVIRSRAEREEYGDLLDRL
jgi:hypothetical protein